MKDWLRACVCGCGRGSCMCVFVWQGLKPEWKIEHINKVCGLVYVCVRAMFVGVGAIY